jgi:ribosomal protein S18 acetylase RimI-like enzyme
MTTDIRVVRITEGRNRAQIEQFVALMSKMYNFHATLHPDWQPKAGWEKGSMGWIKSTCAGNDWFFGLAYPEPEQALQGAIGYVLAGFHYEAPVFVNNRYGYVADMWIEPEFRGSKAAQELLKAAEAFFREQGVRRVQLEVMVNNERGKAFWHKNGFEPFELVMRKSLENSD